MTKTWRYGVIACVVFAAGRLHAAPVVTFQRTLVTQPQTGTQYKALDFHYSASPGAEFTNYRLIVNAITGSMFDPAKLQDNRQYNNTDEGTSGGSADTWANTPLSYAAKDDAGYLSIVTANGGSYNPSGAGAAAPFTFLDWSVFDTATSDDNDLNDFPAAAGGPFPVTAPYQIARVLTSLDSAYTAVVQAFDTTNAGIPTTFNFFGGLDEFPLVSRDKIAAAVGDSVARTIQALPMTSTYSDFTFSGPGLLNQPVFDYDTHVFNWDSAGSAFGTYVASVKVGGGSRTQTATLTIYLIPEPATAALCSLIAIGLCVFRRRG